MPDIYQASKEFRAQLVRQERAAASRIVSHYADAWERIRLQIDHLTAQMAAKRARGGNVSIAWLTQMDRLQSLERAVQREIAQFATFAEMGIVGLQAEAVQSGHRNAVQLIQNGLGQEKAGGIEQPAVTFGRLPGEAAAHLVGFTADGSPLSDLLGELPDSASSIVKKALFRAVTLGTAPRVIAREIKDELGGNLTRALLISRTEMMRSYRAASLQVYQANERVVQGWIWTASLSTRTCAMCISMHGTEHSNDEVFASHPGCRCSPIPFMRRAELNEKIEPGDEWFARQKSSVQEDILGRAKFEAYNKGDFALKDLVGYRDDPKWGPIRWEKSLKSLN